MKKVYFLIAFYITVFSLAVNANSPWDPRKNTVETTISIKTKKEKEFHKYIRGGIGYGKPEVIKAVSDNSMTNCGDMKFGEYYFADLAVGSDAFFDDLVSGVKLRNEVMFHFNKRKATNQNVKIGDAELDAKANLKSYALLVNTYLDIGKFGQITPFVGGGLGFAYHRLGGNIGGLGITSTPGHVTFAWNLTGGLTLPVSDRVRLDFAYRYMDLGRVSAFTKNNSEFTGTVYKQGFEAPTRNHQYMISLRYQF